MSASPSSSLRELAQAYGVQLEYVGMDGRIAPAPASSLLAVLRALGADVSSEADAPSALEARRKSFWARRVEPVVVAWDGLLDRLEVRVPEALASPIVQCRLTLESGRVSEWAGRLVPSEGAASFEGYSRGSLGVPGPLATGYHHLELTFDDGEHSRSMLISAPTRAYQGPEADAGKRLWGVFCPLYALHRESSWGAGDFSDLEALIDWTAKLGGGLVATLPMLATNFDGPDPIISPYSPTSRTFWNEFYLDIDRIPELYNCRAARYDLAFGKDRGEIAASRGSKLVDYGRQMKFKRAVLELLADHVNDHIPAKKEALGAFIAEHPRVTAYATFQAAGERLGRDWRNWPSDLDHAGLDAKAVRYHLYSQWKAHEQLKALAEKAREKGLVWYLDFPIGVDFNSFDVWTHRESFATGASVGCPPDPVFTRGQNWGFPPLHPDRQRESGYACLIESVRAHLKYANALRIDHVMGLHRLFWIPQGAEAKDGAFVSTPAEEIYAILSVESHKHSAWLVGEDLGTVPPEVDSAMKRHNVKGMYVVQYEIRPDPDRPLREAPQASVASVNTHDMPPFAAYWAGLDLDDRKDLGLLSGEAFEREKDVRDGQTSDLIEFLQSEEFLADDAKADDADAVLHALWKWLAASPSGVLLLNIEDLWLETESQNTPNTYLERPNWRRKLRRSFEEFAEDPDVLAILGQVDQLRSKPARSPS